MREAAYVEAAVVSELDDIPQYLASISPDVKSVKDGATLVFRIDEKGNPHAKQISEAKRARDHEGGQAAAAGGGRRAQAPLFDAAAGGVCAVPMHEGAARKFAIKSTREYGF